MPIGLDREIVLVAEDHESLPVASLGQITVQDLQGELDHAQRVDVRQQGEWEQGQLAEAVSKPLPKLVQSLDGLDRERPVAVHCKSGTGVRSRRACRGGRASGRW